MKKLLLVMLAFMAPFKINATANQQATGQLRTAILNDDSGLVQKLIDEGAELNIEDSEGNMPLMYAVYYRPNLEIAAQLLANGADPNLKNSYGISASGAAQEVLDRAISSHDNEKIENIKKIIEVLKGKQKI